MELKFVINVAIPKLVFRITVIIPFFGLFQSESLQEKHNAHSAVLSYVFNKMTNLNALQEFPTR